MCVLLISRASSSVDFLARDGRIFMKGIRGSTFKSTIPANVLFLTADSCGSLDHFICYFTLEMDSGKTMWADLGFLSLPGGLKIVLGSVFQRVQQISCFLTEIFMDFLSCY